MNAKITHYTEDLLLHLWVKNGPVTDAVEDLEVCQPSAIAAFQWIRESYMAKLLQNPILLGRPGSIVQIESLFRHKLKAHAHSFLHC